MTISKEQSTIIYNIKAFCIFSAVCAHTSSVIGTEHLATRLSCFMNSIGSIGVPIFFLLSGMLFKVGTESIFEFLKKKFHGLMIPWMITGTMVWLYIVLRKGGISILTWLNFVLGNGSYLYYMSMLMVCYIVFWGKRFNLIKVSLLGGISIIWLILESFDLVQTPNPYINPLNWMAYFAMGVLIAKYDLLGRVLNGVQRLRYIIVTGWIALIVVIVIQDITITYWHNMYLVFEIFSFGLVLYISTIAKKISWLTAVGKQSFAIYLLHMLFAGIVNTLFGYFGVESLLLFKPMIVILLVMAVIKLLKIIDEKMRCGGNVVRLVGAR